MKTSNQSLWLISFAALMITYIPYVLVEIPSNLVLKKIGPRIMLPGLSILWGTVTTCQSLMQNFSGLLACRFFLGLCEGGLFPGFVLYLSDFYRRSELQRRIGWIYGAASVSGAFSGLLAAAIEKLDGTGGLAGWKWIFLLEGCATVAFGLFALWLLPNSPQRVRIFTPREAAYSSQRLASDTITKESPKITVKHVASAFKDLHILNMGIIGFCNGVVIGGVSYFTPSIVEALGYGETKTQLLSVPPYAIALVLTMIAATAADRWHRRGLTAISTLSLAIVGCALNLTCTSIGARYTAQCLMVSSIYSTAPSLLTWVPNNAAAYGRRATAVGLVFVTSNAAGMVAMWLYPSSTAPRYLLATKINVSFICLEMVLLVFQIALLKRLNRLKVENRAELLAGLENLSTHEQMEVLGDHHPDFKYVL